MYSSFSLVSFFQNLDRQRADRDQKEWEWRRQDELIHPEDKRRIIHIRVPRRTVSLAAANQLS